MLFFHNPLYLLITFYSSLPYWFIYYHIQNYFAILGYYRARLFEVIQKVKEANAFRRAKAPGHKFSGESYLSNELQNHPELAISYIIAPPRMAHYILQRRKRILNQLQYRYAFFP